MELKSKQGRLEFDLLGQHFTVQGNATAEGYSRKMGATCAFFLGPLAHWGEDFGKAPIEEIQEGVVGADNLQAGTLFRAVWAEMKDLHDTGIVPADGAILYSGNVAHVFGDRRVQGRCRQ